MMVRNFAAKDVFSLLGLKNLIYGSLNSLQTFLGNIDSDKIMSRVCRNFLVAGTLAFVLSGCSVVVFEDGPDCPAAIDCPVTAIPSIEAPNDVMEPVAELENLDQMESLKTQSEENKNNIRKLR